MVRFLWSVHVSWVPHHTELHPSRNVYLTSWFIMCVLFLTRGEMSVVLTRVSDNPVTRTSTPVGMSTQPAGSFYLYCFWQDGETSVVPRCFQDPPVTRTSIHSRNINLNQPVHSVCVVFDRWWDVFGPYMYPGFPVTWTSTLLGMYTWPAGLLCLYCFWQVVRCLWSLHMSLSPITWTSTPVETSTQTSWFILSVLFLTGGEMSVVPTWSLGFPCHMDLYPGRIVY